MKRTMNKLAIAIAATALCGTAVAGGDKHKDAMHEKGMTDQPSFTALDVDRNGKVSQTELRNAADTPASDRLTQKWSELDANQDGELDRTEFARFEPVSDTQHKMKEAKPESDY